MIVKFHLQEEPAAVYSFDAPSTHTNVIHIRRSIALSLNVLPSNLVLSFAGLEVSSAPRIDFFIIFLSLAAA